MLRELRIGDMVAKLPIIQGGMGVGVSLSRLAAVSYTHLTLPTICSV